MKFVCIGYSILHWKFAKVNTSCELAQIFICRCSPLDRSFTCKDSQLDVTYLWIIQFWGIVIIDNATILHACISQSDFRIRQIVSTHLYREVVGSNASLVRRRIIVIANSIFTIDCQCYRLASYSVTGFHCYLDHTGFQYFRRYKFECTSWTCIQLTIESDYIILKICIRFDSRCRRNTESNFNILALWYNLIVCFFILLSIKRNKLFGAIHTRRNINYILKNLTNRIYVKIKFS